MPGVDVGMDNSLQNEIRTAEETVRKGASNILTGKGGVYIPPGRLEELLKEQDTDTSSEQYQRFAWEALKKSINGLVNKVNIANIQHVVQELFRENLVRGRGVLAQYIIRAQGNSQIFTHVYAALVAIVNTKLPRIGELILRRLITQFLRSFERNDKASCVNTSKFIAHLVNQNVSHELLALEILTLLLSKPTNDSIEVAISFLKEVGAKLTEVSPKGSLAVFERLRNILHDAQVDQRVQYMIEVAYAVRKDKFKDYEIIVKELDLVEEEDQISHLLRLNDKGSTEDMLNVFRFDPLYDENEKKYHEIKDDILGSSSSEEDSDDDDVEKDVKLDKDVEEEEGEEDDQQDSATQSIIDHTNTNTINLRRSVYLIIQSSLDFEECAHKLLKLKMTQGQDYEFCAMLTDCCAQQRTYEKFYGLLCQRMCLLKKEFMDSFMALFREHYETCHRLDSVKLRNVALLFANLLHTDGIPWVVMEAIHLNEDETTSSSRIFIKHIFQTLAQEISVQKLMDRLNDETLKPYFQGLFPRDNPRNTRFSINFFTSIGLGRLTEDLREFLANASNKPAVTPMPGSTPLHPLLEKADRASRAFKEVTRVAPSESPSSEDSYSSGEEKSEDSSRGSDHDRRRSSGRNPHSESRKRRHSGRESPRHSTSKDRHSKSRGQRRDDSERDRPRHSPRSSRSSKRQK